MFHLKRDETIKRLRCEYRRAGLVVRRWPNTTTGLPRECGPY
jgi:hypothetical protein